jgi:HK97 family phage portal protein
MFTYNQSTKAVNVNNLPEEAWEIISGSEVEKSEGMQCVKSVPFLYRCIDIRAKHVSKFPRDILRNDQPIDETQEPIFSNLNTLLYQTEFALCLYASAYYLKQENLVNLLGVRWLAPQFVKPKFSSDVGLTHFERTLPKRDKPQHLEIEEVVYFWIPPIDTDVGPGIAPAQVALQAAGLLQSSTTFGKSFFDRGAVFPMLLSVEGNPQKEELKRLENWWKKLLGGVRSAWQTIAVRANVKPQIIGPPIDDMAMPELTQIQREDIATALGVPHSMVLSNASNFATAQQDKFNFYDDTIIAQVRLIEEVLNEQLLNQLGLQIKFKEEQLEPYQEKNLDMGNKLKDLVETGILTIDEARETLGLEAKKPITMQLPVGVSE